MEDFQKAVENLKLKEQQYFQADQNFEDIAYYDMMAARARVEALLKEIKTGVYFDSTPIEPLYLYRLRRLYHLLKKVIEKGKTRLDKMINQLIIRFICNADYRKNEWMRSLYTLEDMVKMYEIRVFECEG